MSEITPPRILLFGEELRLRAARRVAVCSGGDVIIEEDPAHIADVASETQPDVVLFDIDHAGPAAMLLATQITGLAPRARMIVLAHPSPPDNIARLLKAPWFFHLLPLESPWFMEELQATLAKLSGFSVFGLGSYLPWGTRILSHTLTASDEKDAVFARIEAFMAAIGVRGRLVSRLHDIADEMVMNAVYDAPIDPYTGHHKYAERSRTERIELSRDEQPTLRFGSDGRVFGISITDPFGGLDPNILKKYIAKGLRRGTDQIDRKAGGAGLGLYFLFDSVNSLCLNLSPGVRTEMIGLIDIRGSFRDVQLSPKGFNIFIEDRA
ncbi:MAG: hypothetical protein KC620_20535 [Myxococcales bacterium]|nr:hypothetical protein [Myxococcales bacterium]